MGVIQSSLSGIMSAVESVVSTNVDRKRAEAEAQASAEEKAASAKQKQDNFDRTMTYKENKLNHDINVEKNRSMEANRNLDIKQQHEDNIAANREQRETKSDIKQANSDIFAEQTDAAQRNSKVNLAKYGDANMLMGSPVGGELGQEYYNLIGQDTAMNKVQSLGEAKAAQKQAYSNKVDENFEVPEYPIFGNRKNRRRERKQNNLSNIHDRNRDKKRDRKYEDGGR